MDEILKVAMSILKSEGYGCSENGDTEDSNTVIVDDMPWTVSTEVIERVLRANGVKGISVVKHGRCVKLEVKQ